MKAPKPLTVKELIKQLRKLPPDMPVAYHAWDNAGPYPYYVDGTGSGSIFYVDTSAYNGSGALVTIPDDDSPMPEYVALAEYNPMKGQA